MSLRKEQYLFLVAVLIAAWLGITFEVGKPPRRSSPAGMPDVTFSSKASIIADPARATSNPKELFLEPSETRDLEPKQDLPFPAMKKLPVVLLPLPLGQHPGALSGLRRAVVVLPARTVSGQGAVDKSDADSSVEAQASGGSSSASSDDPALRYDRLFKRDGQSFWGLFLGTEQQKFELALNPAGFRDGVTVKFQWIRHRDGSRNGPPWALDAKDCQKLEIAKTLRNEVGLESTRLPPAKHNTSKQREFILYLLQKGRLEPWVFQAALKRAQTYLTFATPREEGLLYVAKVLRAMGDLDGEWKLFKNLDKELKGSSFQARGLGLVEARLGLDRLAEKHLREAVETNIPIDPRNYAALATYLLDRGRAVESVEFARKAVDFMSRRDPIKAEQVGFRTLLVRALLAVGDLKGADEAKETGALSDPYLLNEAKYQDACVAYAKQDFANAMETFQECYASGLLPDALLGLAACKFAKGDVDGALADFDRCGEENPRMRHLALAGSGLVLGQIKGEGANALEKIDASLVANPVHPYTLYLQGRQRRFAGDAQGSVVALKQSLREQDGFIEALAELTETYMTIYRSSGDAGALLSAIRYVDRLVELDQKLGTKDVLFLEMQGKIHFEARDLRVARRAFEAGEKTGSKFCQVGLALQDYLQKRADRSEDRLGRMVRDLKPDDPLRLHIEKLLDDMLEHANKEQVEDEFRTADLGRIWVSDGSGSTQLKPKDGVLRVQGELRNDDPVYAIRPLAGPGRFVEFSIDMKVDTAVEFAGAVIEIPGRGATPSRFQIKLGVDDRGKVLLAMVDGSTAQEPMRTNIDVVRGEWHTLRLRTYADPSKKKGPALFLRVTYDDHVLSDARVKTLRRNAGANTAFNTGVRVEGRRRSTIDVSFRNFRRLQIKN